MCVANVKVCLHSPWRACIANIHPKMTGGDRYDAKAGSAATRNRRQGDCLVAAPSSLPDSLQSLTASLREAVKDRGPRQQLGVRPAAHENDQAALARVVKRLDQQKVTADAMWHSRWPAQSPVSG